MTTRRPLTIAGWIILGLVMAAVFAVALGWLVMLLWNALVPELFHGPEVSYWQAVGLLILSHLLFRPQIGRPHPKNGRRPTWFNHLHRKFHGESQPTSGR